MAALSVSPEAVTSRKEYNEEHGITPVSTRKSLESPLDSLYVEDGASRGRGKGRGKSKGQDADASPLTAEDTALLVARLEKEMRQAARDLEFEQDAQLRAASGSSGRVLLHYGIRQQAVQPSLPFAVMPDYCPVLLYPTRTRKKP